MKVAVLTNSLEPAAGGWARYSREVVRALARAGHEVVVYTEGPKKSVIDFEGVPVYSGLRTGTGMNLQNIVKSVFDILWLKGRLGTCDVAHAFVEHHAFAASHLGVPYFVTGHGTYIPRFASNRLFWLLGGSAFIRAARIFFVSDFTRARAIEKVPTLASVAEFIPNGVDTIQFRPTTIPDPHHPYVITVGALKPRKGQDLVVEALIALRATCPNLRYRMVGDTRGGEAFVEKLKSRAEEGNVSSQIEFLHDISDEEMIHLYSASLMCLLPSRTDASGAFEGFPLSLLEAAACGTPILGTYGVGAEHLIEVGKNGFLVEEEDSEGIADAMRTLYENPSKRDVFGKAARVSAEQFSWDAHGAALIREYTVWKQHS